MNFKPLRLAVVLLGDRLAVAALSGTRLEAFVTVKSPGQVNLNTASCVVLRALAFGDAECSAVEQARRDGPYTTVPGQFGGRGLSLTTRTYRVEAEGIVDGRVAARVTAVVQKRPGTPTSVTVLDWSGLR